MKRLLVVAIAFLVLAQIIVPAVMAAELVSTEVVASTDNAVIVVEQGKTVNFKIHLSATGPVAGSFDSMHPNKAAVDTVYSVVGSSVTSTAPSAYYDFYASSTPQGGGYVVTWHGAPTPYEVSATASASSTTPTGDYTSVRIDASFDNPSGTGAKMSDGTPDYLTIRVVAPTAPSDTTPPVITPFITGTLGKNGWYTGDVTVSWTITDTESAITSTSGASPVTITSDTTGTTLTCSATSAGGTTSQSVTIKRDATAPVITGSASPGPNANGWNNQDVTVTFSATDATSGLASVTDPVVLSTEGTGLSATGMATDNAGNTASATVGEINIDKTAPTITGTASPAPNANGWNREDVTVTFAAADALSGIDSVTKPVILSTEGADQSVDGKAIDLAGNSASTTVSGISIDKTKPTLVLTVPKDVLLNQPNAAVTWTASDGLSGLDGPASGSVTVDTATVGTRTGSVSVKDLAGNPESQTWSVAVGYRLGGFLQPIDMDGNSVFKLGSTVPTKFQLTDYNGNYVSTAVANLKTAKISESVVGSDLEAVSTSAATTGSLFRYDATSNQYIFNLATKPLSKGAYQVKAVLDSGQTIPVVISLR